MTFDDYLQGILKSEMVEVIDAHQSDTLQLLLNITTRMFELFPVDEQLAVTAFVVGMIHGTLEGTGETELNQLIGHDPTRAERLQLWTAMYTVAFTGTVKAKTAPDYPHPPRPSAKVLSLVRHTDGHRIAPVQELQENREPEAGEVHAVADMDWEGPPAT